MAALPTVRCFEKSLPGTEPCVLAKQSRGFYLWQVRGSGLLFTGTLLRNVKEGSTPVFSGNVGLRPGSNRGKNNPWKNGVAAGEGCRVGRGRWPEGETEALAAHCAARPGRGSAALSDDALTSLSCGVCGSGHQMRHGRRFGRPRGLRTAPVLGPVLQEGGQARSPPSLPAAPAEPRSVFASTLVLCARASAVGARPLPRRSSAGPFELSIKLLRAFSEVGIFTFRHHYAVLG